MELLFSVFSIVLIFLIVYVLLKDLRVGILSSAILAFTPLFMSYSRSNILDTPAVTFLLLSVFLLSVYVKRKSMLAGIAAVFSIAYMLNMKVDMVFAIGVLLLLLLLDKDKFDGPEVTKNLKRLALLLIIAAIVAFPALLYVYAASNFSFGAPQGQPNFSFAYLRSNFVENLLFWFGVYDKVYVAVFHSYYYDEFPLAYSVFALAGALFLFLSKKYRELAFFLLWFAIVFLFYTSYYAGGVNYSAGDDVRYFISAFPVIAVLAAYGFVSIFNLANKKKFFALSGNSKQHKNAPLNAYLFLGVMLVLLFGESAWFFSTVVTMSPYHIYPFAAERYDERFIMQNYKLIPPNCFVLTFKPPLWYVLGRGNIYAGWANLSSYNSKLMNLSHGCLYFDYSISCYINLTGFPNTEQQCEQVMKSYKMYPIAISHLDNYSWNVSFYLFKILGPANSTVS